MALNKTLLHQMLQRQLFDNFAENIDQKKKNCAVFLDLKKAFDTVNHQILLAKLEKYGIRGLPLQLLESYLNNRLQFRVVNNTKSKFNCVTCGIQQGSTLGPLLFLLYINDMRNLISNFDTKLFANDTVFTLTNSCPKLLNKNVNSKLVKIDEWLKVNKLSLNTNKAKFMVLTKQRSAKHFDIRIGKTNIEQVNEIKYLGIIFNDKLSWKSHIGKRGATSEKILFFESGSGFICDKEKLIVPYCSQIFQLKRGANSKSFFF